MSNMMKWFYCQIWWIDFTVKYDQVICTVKYDQVILLSNIMNWFYCRIWSSDFTVKYDELILLSNMINCWYCQIWLIANIVLSQYRNLCFSQSVRRSAWLDAVMTPDDKKRVHSCVLKHPFCWGSWGTNKNGKNPQKCSLQRATNITFKFRG